MAEEGLSGETTIEDEVVASVAGIAAREVEGVASLGQSSIQRAIAERVGTVAERTRGVEVEAGKRQAIVDLTLTIRYGFSIPKVVGEVRQKVAARLLEICGLEAIQINVRIVGVQFPEETKAEPVRRVE
ncbi:MAG: Asp23/Gls24 family envelope stress response protein [Chloroflexota bacterium]